MYAELLYNGEAFFDGDHPYDPSPRHTATRLLASIYFFSQVDKPKHGMSVFQLQQTNNNNN